MLGFLGEALKGLRAEIWEAEGAGEKLRVLPRALGTLAAELASLAAVAPYGLKTSLFYGSIPSFPAFMESDPAAAAAVSTSDSMYRLGVLLDRRVQYGHGPRHVMDMYVPLAVAKRLRQDVPRTAVLQPPGEGGHTSATPASTTTTPACSTAGSGTAVQQQPYGAPVVFFVHGGVWASGEPWHYAWLAVRLAQAGCVVAVPTYTLYPQALVPQMVGEVSAALTHVLDTVGTRYGGDPGDVSAVGHSAGAHLVAMALMQRAVAAVSQSVSQTGAVAGRAGYEASGRGVAVGGGGAAGGTVQGQSLLSLDGTDAGSGSTAGGGGVAGVGVGSEGQPQAPEEDYGAVQVSLQEEGEGRASGVKGVGSGAGASGRGGQEGAAPGRAGWAETGVYLHGAGTSVSDALASLAAVAGGTDRRGSETAGGAGRHAEPWPGGPVRAGAPSQAGHVLPGQTGDDRYLGRVPLPHAAIRLTDARQPARFVGIAGVYDIGKHYEYERSRGVHHLSMMARAMGGHVHFPPLSPSIILSAAATAAEAASQPPSQHPDVLQPVVVPAGVGSTGGRTAAMSGTGTPAPLSFYAGFDLLGDAIPARSGMAGAGAVTGMSQLQEEVLAVTGFNMAAAAHLPPAFVLTGCVDHMVPWHEGAELVTQLTRCGVPARHLVYQYTGHSDFVMKWPLMGPGAVAAAAQLLEAKAEEAVTAVTGNDGWRADGGLSQQGGQVVNQPAYGSAPQQGQTDRSSSSSSVGAAEAAGAADKAAARGGARGGAGTGTAAGARFGGRHSSVPLPAPPPAQQLPHRHVLLGGLPDFGRDLIRIVRSGSRRGAGRTVARSFPGVARGSLPTGGPAGMPHVQVGLARLSKL